MDSIPTPQPSNIPPSPEPPWRVAMPGLAIALLLIVALLMGNKYYRQKIPTSSKSDFVTPTPSFEKPVVVDVSGRVKHPGVYELPFNARVYQAIEKAGGILADADLSAINRAAWVEDGSKIEVPSKTVSAPKSTLSLELPQSTLGKNTLDKSTFGTPALTPTDQPITQTSPQEDSPKLAKTPPAKQLPAAPIDLNRATAEDLQRLPGIGPAMAERILQYRKEQRGFKSVDDLDGVRGIGQKTLEKLRPYVTVKPLPFQNAAPATSDSAHN